MHENKEANQYPYYDKLIHSEASLQRNNLIQRGKVKGRTITTGGSIIDTCNENPVLDTLKFDVELDYRDVRECVANVIGDFFNYNRF